VGRLFPVAPLVSRYTSVDIPHNDVIIPKSSTVLGEFGGVLIVATVIVSTCYGLMFIFWIIIAV
jgi:hypothetical protein